ncbi:uncharacterized protein JCM10292_001172 [Rhodotorula paludigena]|uniref:uncharacterized protein n=1 Tax=Rhodotorula paludigena TaxID=86838 RepID=UPI003175EA28
MPPGPLPALQLSRCDPLTIPRYLAGPHFVVGPPPSPHVADAPPPPYFDAPQWDVGLELHYQLFDRSVWVILACDDVLDRIAWERVDAVLASADTQWRSVQQKEEYVERWRLLGQRRIERWQRLLALHCAREAFLAIQRRIRPGLSECELSATIPPANAAFDKAPCAPIQSGPSSVDYLSLCKLK